MERGYKLTGFTNNFFNLWQYEPMELRLGTQLWPGRLNACRSKCKLPRATEMHMIKSYYFDSCGQIADAWMQEAIAGIDRKNNVSPFVSKPEHLGKIMVLGAMVRCQDNIDGV